MTTTPDVVDDVPTSRLLRDARQLLADGWTQRALARLENGNEVISDELLERCTSFCLVGAIGAVTICSGLPRLRKHDCLAALVDAIPEITLSDVHAAYARKSWNQSIALTNWNDADERTQADVLAAVDAAISHAEQTEQRRRS